MCTHGAPSERQAPCRAPSTGQEDDNLFCDPRGGCSQSGARADTARVPAGPRLCVPNTRHWPWGAVCSGPGCPLCVLARVPCLPSRDPAGSSPPARERAVVTREASSSFAEAPDVKDEDTARGALPGGDTAECAGCGRGTGWPPVSLAAAKRRTRLRTAQWPARAPSPVQSLTLRMQVAQGARDKDKDRDAPLVAGTGSESRPVLQVTIGPRPHGGAQQGRGSGEEKKLPR